MWRLILKLATPEAPMTKEQGYWLGYVLDHYKDTEGQIGIPLINKDKFKFFCEETD